MTTETAIQIQVSRHQQTLLDTSTHQQTLVDTSRHQQTLTTMTTMTTDTAVQIQVSRHQWTLVDNSRQQQTLVDSSRQIVTWIAFAILAMFIETNFRNLYRSPSLRFLSQKRYSHKHKGILFAQRLVLTALGQDSHYFKYPSSVLGVVFLLISHGTME